MKVLKFCPGCGENVNTYIVDRGGKSAEGKRAIDECCIFCGMPVEDPTNKTVIPVASILTADDSEMIRELMKDLLIKEKLAKTVESCTQGADFLKIFTKRSIENNPPSLVVLDVAMPILNGVNAAIAIRAIESSFGFGPIPVMFFTSQKCDDNFKKVLSYCKPAHYVNKGISSTPSMLSSRIRQVIIRLLQESQGLYKQ